MFETNVAVYLASPIFWGALFLILVVVVFSKAVSIVLNTFIKNDSAAEDANPQATSQITKNMALAIVIGLPAVIITVVNEIYVAFGGTAFINPQINTALLLVFPIAMGIATLSAFKELKKDV